MSKTEPTWPEEVDKRLDALVTLRRDFHRHPELSFRERRTSEVIAERLHAAGLEVRTGMAETGVVGVLRGDRPGRTVAWRADIDALPPGCYFRVGIGQPDGRPRPHHAPEFEMNEAGLPLALRVALGVMRRALSR